MESVNVTVGLALLAGIVSFFSPCVLSLVPAYVGYLGSRTVTPEGQPLPHRRATLSHGLAFVLGFSIFFIALGAAASAPSGLLFDAREWLARIGGVIVIVLGLHTLGILRLSFLEMDTRAKRAPDRRWGYASSVLMGVFFSAGWSPCIGPILGAVLTLSLNSDSVNAGVILLAAYSLGLALPFLAAAVGVGWVTTLLRRYSNALHYVTWASGALLILIGVLLLTNALQPISNLGLAVDYQTRLDENLIRLWRNLTGG
ncbi:MAG: sulfite exporter TauE/SafE family protein [Chloroflexi bacterium]|nr:sulfite exporter TauE/SafE family protein [Chloroflexota bacterium]